MAEPVDGFIKESTLYPPPTKKSNQNFSSTHLKDRTEYETLYNESINSPEVFWKRMADEHIEWIRPFKQVSYGSFKDGNLSWFVDGQLNVSYNCVDRHAFKHPQKTAIIWEADEPGHAQTYTYAQVLAEVCKLSNTLMRLGVKKGDTIAIYLPMVPEAAFAMLACARIGAIHSVIFAGFSSDALRDRILDAQCKIVITADQGRRGGKNIQLKAIADKAVEECGCVKKIIVLQRTGDPSISWNASRDVWWHEETKNERLYCPCEPMNSEDPLFLLYTSGSTGTPKGILHTQAGYLLGAILTTRYIFDIHKNDVHGCMADVGWITGHTYIVYGPLANGTTTVMFESVPTYPTPSRYCMRQMVDDYKISSFYTAPTAIRALRKLGDEHLTAFDLSSLRVIGSVGEPINPDAWIWYYEKVGRSKCAVVDTYWQTETGSIIISPLPTVTHTKPGSATFPFFGIDPVILDAASGVELLGNNVTGVLAVRSTFPSVCRSVYGDHLRYMDTYMKPFPGYYFTGDGATRDSDGYIWIRGRVDDVINISGHRLSTAEIEAALVLDSDCAECAVVGVPDELTGQAMVCFCVIKHQVVDEDAVIATLRKQVRQHIGSFATPRRIIIVADLPKTRSGKIMRRILRKCAAFDFTVEDAVMLDYEERMGLGDLSTLADPSIIKALIKKLHCISSN